MRDRAEAEDLGCFEHLEVREAVGHELESVRDEEIEAVESRRARAHADDLRTERVCLGIEGAFLGTGAVRRRPCKLAEVIGAREFPPHVLRPEGAVVDVVLEVVT